MLLEGKTVSDGIGIGKAVVLNESKVDIKKEKIDDVKKELDILYSAYNTVIKETEDIVITLTGQEKSIMEAYLLILKDETLIQDTLNLIQNEKYNAVYAVETGINKVVDTFKNMDDSYMAQRASDIADMKDRIIAKLSGVEYVNLTTLPKDTVIVAKELTTSDTAKLNLKNIAAIVTELGGMTSHVSIMARNHEIPAIIGIKDVLSKIKNKDKVAVDAMDGKVYVSYDEKIYNELILKKEKLQKEKEELERFKNKKTITKDLHKVELVANIGVPKDVKLVIENTAEGVGLFRSEFLYMDSHKIPTEEEQFLAYKQVVEKLDNMPVIIRTLDIGGDKGLEELHLEKEANPFLGYRAIRLCLDNVELFKTQLRALLRASYYGNLLIMLPMISSIEELREAKNIIEQVKEELSNKNIPYKKDVKVGIMIEIPSAALIADALAKECDFFSIGTNDLIQYTIAVERGNEKISKLYTKFHPSVIKLVKMAIDGAHKANIFCGMCGEAASDELYIPLLIGLGLDEFSMSPTKILNSRKVISKLNYSECKEVTKKILTLARASEVKKELEEFVNKTM